MHLSNARSTLHFYFYHVKRIFYQFCVTGLLYYSKVYIILTFSKISILRGLSPKTYILEVVPLSTPSSDMTYANKINEYFILLTFLCYFPGECLNEQSCSSDAERWVWRSLCKEAHPYKEKQFARCPIWSW